MRLHIARRHRVSQPADVHNSGASTRRIAGQRQASCRAGGIAAAHRARGRTPATKGASGTFTVDSGFSFCVRNSPSSDDTGPQSASRPELHERAPLPAAAPRRSSARDSAAAQAAVNMAGARREKNTRVAASSACFQPCKPRRAAAAKGKPPRLRQRGARAAARQACSARVQTLAFFSSRAPRRSDAPLQ